MSVTLLGKGKADMRIKGIGKGTNKETRAKIDAWIRKGANATKVSR